MDDRTARLLEVVERAAERFCEKRQANWQQQTNCGDCLHCAAKQALEGYKNDEDAQV